MFEFETERERHIWLATWIDTEGNITLQKRDGSQYRNKSFWLPWLYITNTSLPAILELQTVTGATMRTRKRAGTNWKDKYELYISPNKCRELLPRIRPFLVIKQRQADLMLEALELLRDNMRHSGGSGEVRVKNHEVIDRNFARLNEIHQELAVLNRRGTGAE